MELPPSFIDKISGRHQLHGRPNVAMLSEAIQTVKEKGRLLQDGKLQNFSPKMSADLQDIVTKLRSGAMAVDDARQRFDSIMQPVEDDLRGKATDLRKLIKDNVLTETHREKLQTAIRLAKTEGAHALAHTYALIRNLQEHSVSGVHSFVWMICGDW